MVTATVKGVDQERVARAVREILEAIGEDPAREGLRETPRRIAEMYEELFAGLHQDPREVLTTGFQESHREMVILKNIPFYSLCEHHFLPFHGRAHVGYVPEGRIVGASKIARAVDILARHPRRLPAAGGHARRVPCPGAGRLGVGYTVAREDLEPAFGGEWRALLPRASTNKVFASPTWLRVWWQEFGGGRELILLSVRRDGELVGVAPLMRDGDRICFAGDTEICDYLDFIAAAGEEDAVVSAVLRSLSEEPWDELVLWAVPEGSPTLRALQSAAPGFGLRVSIETEDVCPQLELPATW